MNTRKTFSSFMIVVLLVMAVGTPASVSAQEPSPPTKVGLITDEFNHTSEMSFGWLAYQGLLQAQAELGIVPALYEPVSETDYATSLQQCANDGNALCIGAWPLYDVITNAASQNPDTLFALVDFSFDNPPSNLRAIAFDEKQSAYLAGALAGKMTTSNVIGAVGGSEWVPPVVNFVEGYRNGAQCANSDVNVLIQYIDSFTDPETGAAVAQGMIGQGADVVFAPAGGTGTGAILYSAQHNVWSIGVDVDEYLSTFDNGAVAGSDKLLTSAMKNLDFAVYQTIEDYLNGTFSSGTVTYHLADGGVGLAPYHETDSSIPQSIKDYVEGVEAGILDGSIDINESCRAEPPISSPTFGIWPRDNYLKATGWQPNSPVEISVDDPANGPGVDYSAIQDTDDNGYFDYYGYWDGISFQPRLLVTLDDGVHQAKEQRIPDLALTDGDLEAESLQGTATPGATVEIRAHGSNGWALRHETADEKGTWVANFGTPGDELDEQAIIDLRPGDNGTLKENDADGDFTQIGWNLPNPSIGIWLGSKELHSWGWWPNTQIQVTVDDPSNGQGTDFSTTLTSDEWGNVHHGFGEEFNLQPGFIVTLNGGSNLVREHTIANLTLTGVDAETDMLYGTADPGAVVNVMTWGDALRHEIADENGNWIANFGVLGDEPDEQNTLDLQPNTSGYITQSDGDGDFTQIGWRIPDLRITIYLADDYLSAGDWWPGAPIDVRVDDPTTPASTDFSTTLYANEGGYIHYALGEDIDLQPGFVVTLDGGTSFIRELTIPNLAITNIDVEAEIVYGVTRPHSVVNLWGCADDCADRHVAADESGNWAANFALPGDEPDQQGTMDLRPDGYIFAGQNDEDGDSVLILRYIRNTTFRVHPNGDWIEGDAWEPNTTVNLAFDDPATPANPDYTTSVMSGNSNSDPHYFSLSLGGAFDIKPGVIVTASDEYRTKQLTVSALLVSGVNPNEDTVWGVASPYSPLRVHIWCPAYAIIETESDPDGNWTADFTGQCDLVPNHRGRAEQFDADGDSTADDWRVRNPGLSIGISGDIVNGWDWTPNSAIQVTVDNPADGPNVDFSTAVSSDQQGSFHFGFLPAFDLQPGYIVTLDDGIYNKEHVISNLSVTSADAATDIVNGTAGAGSAVRVSTCWSSGCAVRHATADGNGNWTANFGIPGNEPDEQDIFDLQPGTWGGADQYDADGDYTNVYWQVPNPSIGVYPADRQVYGWQWKPWATIQVMAGVCPVTTIADQSGNFYIQLSSTCVLRAGDTVSVSDGVSTKEHVITNLTVAGANADSETVSGTAQPGSIVDVWICGQNGCTNRHETADGNGNWSANFGTLGDQPDEQTTFDIQPGQGGDASQRAADGNMTSVRWRVPRPIIWGVNASSNMLNGQDWPRNATVWISIDDPATSDDPDSTTTQTTDSNGNFAHRSQYDIAVGDIVSVTDGNKTKQVTVSNFEVTAFDATTGTLSGVGTPNTNGGVWILDPQGWAPFVIDSSGHWQVDLSGAADLASWSHGFAIEQDSDGDGTQSNWPSHYIQASINGPGHSVEGYDWPLGSSVTLTVDNTGNETGIDYTDVQVLERDEWGRIEVRFDLGDFRLETGAVVTLTDGAITKDMTVSYLEVTGVETANDRIFGKADPNSIVEVEGQHHVYRSVVADQSGNWMADFSTAGPGNDEQDLDDIQEGRWITIRQYVNGNYLTRLQWQVPDYRVVAYPDEDVIAATDFWPRTPVTITVDDPENGVGVDLTRSGEINMYPGGWNCQTWWGYCFVLDLRDAFDVQPGQLITITDGNHTVSHVVTNLLITDLVTADSTLSGTAEPLSEIYLDLWPSCGQRHLFADEEGNWLEDFSVPGDEDSEQETCDFSSDPLRDVVAYQPSGEGETWVGWPMPLFMLNIYNDSSWQGLDAWNWPLGSQVTLTVDDPQTQGIDYTEAQTMGQPSDGGHTSHAMYLQENQFSGQPGFTITLSDGNQTKSMIVPLLRGTEYDLEADIVRGVTDPLASVRVACDVGAEPTVVADSAGNWTANFAELGYDLQPGTWCEPQMYDDDWDHIVLRDWGIPFDIDGDGVSNDIDNAPAIFNPDQRDIDHDGTADVLDPCPDDETNTCNANGSVAKVIGEQGGMVITPDGKASLNIPAGSVHEDISFTITDMGSGYEMASDAGPMLVVHSYSIQPNGTQFDPPATITFHWDDVDNDGHVDGTAFSEADLLLIKDGVVITSSCDVNPGCSMSTNELTVEVNSLSLFALAVPVEWTLRGFYEPVDMNGVYNIVKGGSTVPLKFEILVGSTELTDTTYIRSLTYAHTSCEANAITDVIETTVVGGTSLRYDSVSGQFIYNWKTPTNPGVCYQVTMTTNDGSSLMAYFKLK